VSGAPWPAIVTQPATKSVGCEGIGSGLQRSWFGVATAAPNSFVIRPLSMRRKGWCTAPGRMRYIQVRRFAPRGAVNAVPESCSAYRP
jgi:hypothetical protein